MTVGVAENMTSAHDLLLEWASEMSGGSWSQWCEACRELDVEPNSAMRDLAALGRVEIDWSTSRFSCPTPTAGLPSPLFRLRLLDRRPPSRPPGPPA